MTPLGGVLTSPPDSPSGSLTLQRESALFSRHPRLAFSFVSARQRLDRFNQKFTHSFSFERLFFQIILPEFPDRCCRLAPVIATLWESRNGVHFAFRPSTKARNSLHLVFPPLDSCMSDRRVVASDQGCLSVNSLREQVLLVACLYFIVAEQRLQQGQSDCASLAHLRGETGGGVRIRDLVRVVGCCGRTLVTPRRARFVSCESAFPCFLV